MNILFEIFKKTLNPMLTIREFRQYYFSQHPDEMDVTLVFDKEALVGFFSAAFYPRKLDGKKVIICRSALGMSPGLGRGQFPIQVLFAKFIRYKLLHPFTPVYITGFMANPLIYAMICKYTAHSWPRRDLPVPPHIAKLKEQILTAMGLAKKEESPFVVKIHFQVNFKESDVHRFETSVNPDVQHYLGINPGYSRQMGVLVLVPVTPLNMIYASVKYLCKWGRKKTAAISTAIRGIFYSRSMDPHRT